MWKIPGWLDGASAYILHGHGTMIGWLSNSSCLMIDQASGSKTGLNFVTQPNFFVDLFSQVHFMHYGRKSVTRPQVSLTGLVCFWAHAIHNTADQSAKG